MPSDVKIPASVWIIVGAGMILMSVFVGVQQDSIEKFTLFILAGAVFIVFGFFKILLKEKKDAKRARGPQPHHAEHHTASKPHVTHPHRQVSKPPAAPHASRHHKPADQSHRSHHAAGPHGKSGASSSSSSHHHGREHVTRCSNCGVKLHHLFKFCPNCGQKLK